MNPAMEILRTTASSASPNRSRAAESGRTSEMLKPHAARLQHQFNGALDRPAPVNRALQTGSGRRDAPIERQFENALILSNGSGVRRLRFHECGVGFDPNLLVHVPALSSTSTVGLAETCRTLPF